MRPGGAAGIGRTSVASTVSAGGSSGPDGEAASDTPLIRAQEVQQQQQQPVLVRPRSAAGQPADAAEAEAGQRGAAPGSGELGRRAGRMLALRAAPACCDEESLLLSLHASMVN